MRKAIIGLTVLLGSSIFASLIQPQFAKADPGPLELARDTVSSTVGSVTNVSHSIYFVLPTNAQQVDPNDWVTIDMPNHGNITDPTFLTGIYGTPQVTTVGTQIRITNIAILPGAGVTIANFSAQNPPTFVSQAVTISILEDSLGGTIRNQAVVLPSDSGYYVGVSATVDTPLSSLSVTGYTGPGSFVTMSEDLSIVGTTTSDPSGFFRFTLTGLIPGAHAYRISSTDEESRTTSQSSLSLFLLENNLTNVTNLLLSPTVAVDLAEIDPGEELILSGSAKPSSQVNIFVEAPLRSYTTTTGSDGLWTFTLISSETLGFTPGEYRVYAVVQDQLGNQSISSPTSNFTVKSPDISNPPPACDISHGDLNCDSVTNLVDFSILLFHWQTNHRVADINNDTRVNLTDFSIQMFYFVR